MQFAWFLIQLLQLSKFWKFKVMLDFLWVAIINNKFYVTPNRKKIKLPIHKNAVPTTQLKKNAIM